MIGKMRVPAVSEFDLIARIRTRAGRRDDMLLGIGDDAALLRVPVGHDLVVSTDTLNAGVHFPDDTATSVIGWKSLAVNLSDLAAMSAEPAWCTLNLSLPNADAAWLDAFLDGFLALAMQHRVALIGGDTTRGPLSVTVTVHGFVPQGTALRRDGARASDEVWISGMLGDAAGALRQWRDGTTIDVPLRERLDRPTPRIALGLALRGIANACIDVSDGLLADLGHVLDESGVGAQIEPASLPTSEALAAAFDAATRRELQLGGGDDYELCFTAPSTHANDVIAAAAKVGVAATRIGWIEARPGLRLREADGSVHEAQRRGYVHFDAKGDA
jgi:thiamine-monophosphate kinase